MFEKIKEKFLNLVTSRLFVLLIIFCLMAGILIMRVFNLQIVHGQEYLDNFKLKIIRERSIASTRGNIFDKDGNLLAYNELAYNITIEDVYESGSLAAKNKALNKTIYELIKLVEKNGDSTISDFKIVVDADDNYVFTVEDTQLLRFLADIYGHANIKDLEYEEETATPDDVIEFMCKRTKYGIGDYTDPNDKDTFVVGMGYTKDEVIQILNIRYALSANAFQKYIATTVASDVSEETLAIVMENSDILPGVSVAQDTVRRYNNSVYFSQIIGYTGKISKDEYEQYSADNSNYSLNDYVGKTGIEQYMETDLQGVKGKETIYVDNLGKIMDTTDRVEPIAGNNVYLTIDSDLQMSVYHIIEQKIAGILVSKIKDIRNYEPDENTESKDIIIPIANVYNALLENNVIQISHFSDPYASETEKEVYEAFLAKQMAVSENLREELLTTATPYEKLTREYQNYESYIVSMLSSSSCGIIMKDEIDKSDATYLAWTKNETISLKDYLNYCIGMRWIDVTKLDLNDSYSDSEEIYSVIVDYIIHRLNNNTEFSKILYKYMIENNDITGKQICTILWDQDLINIEEAELMKLKDNKISAYNFILDRISNLDITPAQLALEPCAGSCVITDVKTGNILALVSYPSYDNNKLANSADAQYLVKMNNDLSKPLWNYATQYKSAPGSTFKMVSAIAGLQENVINLRDTITCTGYFDTLTGKVHKCWISPGAHGKLNVVGGIANSCNCFFYEVGYRLSDDGEGYNSAVGIDTLYKYADLFGLSEKSGVEISEAEPQVSTEYPVPSAIGQGNHAYTSVGLARYVTTIANSGTCYNLTLLDRTEDANHNLLTDFEAEIRNKVELPQNIWDAVHLGMKQVVEKKSYYTNIGVTVAGKTGTAEESNSSAAHALFVAYAPYENPEIAVVTRIANGYSSDYASQITKDIIMYYYHLAEPEEIITGTAEQPLTIIGTGD